MRQAAMRLTSLPESATYATTGARPQPTDSARRSGQYWECDVPGLLRNFATGVSVFAVAGGGVGSPRRSPGTGGNRLRESSTTARSSAGRRDDRSGSREYTLARILF